MRPRSVVPWAAGGGVVLAAGLAVRYLARAPQSAVVRSDPCETTSAPALEGYVASRIVAGADGGRPIDIVVADMDRDGHGDIVVARGGLDRDPNSGRDLEFGVIEVLYGPHHRPTNACNTTIDRADPGRRWRSQTVRPYGKMAVGDVDRDGCLDIAVGKFSGGVDLFTSKSAGSSCSLPTSPIEIAAASSRDPAVVGVSDVDLADLDGDGRLDLVVARYRRAVPLSGSVQQVYWNDGTTPFAGDPWESLDLVAGAMTVLTTRIDDDGFTDVLFGARGIWTDAGSTTGWGVLYRGGPGRALSTAGTVLLRPNGPDNPRDSPMVVDVDALSPPPSSRVLVSSSLHWCANAACEAFARPEVYEWSGTGMQRTPRFSEEKPGNWLPAGVGHLDSDARADVVIGLACGREQQAPGHLRVYRTDAPEPVAAFGQRNYMSRAVAIHDVDGLRGDEIIFGDVDTSADNTGTIVILYKCDG